MVNGSINIVIVFHETPSFCVAERIDLIALWRLGEYQMLRILCQDMTERACSRIYDVNFADNKPGLLPYIMYGEP